MKMRVIERYSSSEVSPLFDFSATVMVDEIVSEWLSLHPYNRVTFRTRLAGQRKDVACYVTGIEMALGETDGFAMVVDLKGLNDAEQGRASRRSEIRVKGTGKILSPAMYNEGRSNDIPFDIGILKIKEAAHG